MLIMFTLLMLLLFSEHFARLPALPKKLNNCKYCLEKEELLEEKMPGAVTLVLQFIIIFCK